MLPSGGCWEAQVKGLQPVCGFSSSECGVFALGSSRFGDGALEGFPDLFQLGFESSPWASGQLTVVRVVTTPSDGAQGNGIQMDLLGPRQSSLLYTLQGYLANQHEALVRCGRGECRKPSCPTRP